MGKTGSHLAKATFRKRLEYLAGLVRNNYRLRSADKQALEGHAGKEIQRLADMLVDARQAVGNGVPASLKGIRLLEIGCGQRCLAGLVFHSLGINYTGIDLDVPTFKLSPAIALKMWRLNGLFRLTKAVVRHLLFDQAQFSAYDAAFRQRGSRLRMDGVDVRVSSAEIIGQWSEKFDIIYSFDVFEHLPPAVLQATIPAMLNRLNQNGFCLIRLNPFPAIGGGHLVEWYNLHDTSPRPIPAWQHLRDPEHATGDTYLNRLSHGDYLALFERYGKVCRHHPNDQLGECFHSATVAREFPQFSKEELCASGWTYIVQRRTSAKETAV